jgi:hypothetical protein
MDYSELSLKVTRSSTLEVKRVLYRVPSRLIGEHVRGMSMIVWCYLSAKPQAFWFLQFRDELLPTEIYRTLWRQCDQQFQVQDG